MRNESTLLMERRSEGRSTLDLKGMLRKGTIFRSSFEVTILNRNTHGITLIGHPSDFMVGDKASLKIIRNDKSIIKLSITCRWVYNAQNSPNRSGWVHTRKDLGSPITGASFLNSEGKSCPDRRKTMRRIMNSDDSINDLRLKIRRFSDYDPVSPLSFYPDDLPFVRTYNRRQADIDEPKLSLSNRRLSDRRSSVPLSPVGISHPALLTGWRIVLALRDLMMILLPLSISLKMIKKGDFAFLAHPRDLRDVQRHFPLAKYMPERILHWWLKHQWPVSGVRITGIKSDTGKFVSGWVLFCPLTAREMMRDRNRAKRRVLTTAKLAHKMGARVVGLGAFTSIVTRDGLDVIDKIPIHVTTGNALSAAGALQNVAAACHLLGLSLRDATIAIVGAAGNVGSACARLLASEIKRLILVDTNQKKIELLAKELGKFFPQISHSTDPIINADVVITVTNTPGAVVKPENLKHGAIVVDAAQPKNVSERVIHSRNDVLVAESAVFRFPGLSCPFDMGVGVGESLGCMTETIILASKEGLKKNNVGPISANEVIAIYTAARLFGIRLGYFRTSQGYLNETNLKIVKKARQ
jgi:fatty aldehyde-generating acyl-ACP reductase